MPRPLKLSVLDQSPAAQDKTQDHAIRESLALYRARFRPSARLARPTATVSVWALAADTEAERSIIQRQRERAIVGTADQVVSRLVEIADAFALDEIVINTWTHDPVARHRSYEIIAQAAGL